jgi:hypothetical protein
VLLSNINAESKGKKYVCSEPNPAEMCSRANTCGSSSSPCSVDVKQTADSASSTPSIPNAKGNSLFCVKVGSTVKWNSTGKDNDFVVDVGPASPFEPAGPSSADPIAQSQSWRNARDASSIPPELASQERATECVEPRMRNSSSPMANKPRILRPPGKCNFSQLLKLYIDSRIDREICERPEGEGDYG